MRTLRHVQVKKVPIASKDHLGAARDGPWHNRDRPWRIHISNLNFLTYRKTSVTDRDTAWHSPKWPFSSSDIWVDQNLNNYWCFLQTHTCHPTSFQQFWVQFTPSGNTTILSLRSLAMSDLEKVMMEAGKFRYKDLKHPNFWWLFLKCGMWWCFFLIHVPKSIYIYMFTPSYWSGGYSCHCSRETKEGFST